MLHISEPDISLHERQAVTDCLMRNELTHTGGTVAQFERAFAAWAGSRYAISCTSGTTALHLALLALGVKPGDKVVVPSLTYVATAAAVRYCGATPIFCDVDRRTWVMDVERVAQLVQEHQAVGCIGVHLYGNPCDAPRLRAACESRGAWFIEDAAQAHGATFNERRVGSIGTIGCFSFYANKIMTTGEGGMCITDSSSLAELMCLYRGQGQHPTRRYHHVVVGYNYRMTAMQAALGRVQLQRVDDFIRHRETLARRYFINLGDEFEFQHTLFGARPVCWLFSLLVPHGVRRDDVMTALSREGIETRPVFPSVASMPPYGDRALLPATEDIALRGLSLPTHTSMTEADVDRVCDVLRKVVSQ